MTETLTTLKGILLQIAKYLKLANARGVRRKIQKKTIIKK